jgi:hypothetical protein
MNASAGGKSRRRTFACLLGGFLLAPFIPVEFTSILTATVWSVSGGVYALAFLTVGTFFRLDSFSIFTGIEEILGRVLRIAPGAEAGYLTVGIMFLGNVTTAYFFKLIISSKIARRLPSTYLLSTRSRIGQTSRGSHELASFAGLGRFAGGVRRILLTKIEIRRIWRTRVVGARIQESRN